MSDTNSGPVYPVEVESFMATLAHIAAAQGNAAAVAILSEAEGSISFIEPDSSWRDERYYYTLRLRLPADLYGRLGPHRQQLEKWLSELASEVSRAHSDMDIVSHVVMPPVMASADGWRASAKGWLRGEGINNQGRVRSDNIAARERDGLLFRSQPEIYLYLALKAKGVYMAPLPCLCAGARSTSASSPTSCWCTRAC
jgi:hypothetical protein